MILGRFGPYIKCGEATTALPKEVDPGSVDFAQALELLLTAAERRKKAAEPLRTLGNDPEFGSPIQVKDGRYGPYVTDGKTNASIPKKFTVDTITLDDAAELLKKKRIAGPMRPWRGKKK